MVHFPIALFMVARAVKDLDRIAPDNADGAKRLCASAVAQTEQANHLRRSLHGLNRLLSGVVKAKDAMAVDHGDPSDNDSSSANDGRGWLSTPQIVVS